IVGVEEDLFPSMMSKDSLAAIEEERRLLYVAITRAEKNCVITFAKSRFRNGSTNNCHPSRFLRDIDPQFLSMGATSSIKPKKEDSYSSHRTRPLFGGMRQERPSTATVSPISQPRPFAPSGTSKATSQAASGDFTLHSISEIDEGSSIMHNKFGVGTISKVDTSGSDPKIVVDFEVMGQRTLLLKFAKFKIL
ncbi:MAG: ATP-dependent DNA helicase, partial [Muribaculaceae bacterium]|nr:ATP-dependent DNA helicase [Muribaculaceae bacterium]